MTSRTGLCYYTNCRDTSGSVLSTNLFVSSDTLNMKLGEPKEYSKPTLPTISLNRTSVEIVERPLWNESDWYPVGVLS